MANHPWHDIALPQDLSAPVPVVIEIASGSRVKYELDKESGLLRVDRILSSAVHYPASYGFIPRTFCGDGDPLDVLVHCSEPIQPLSIMRAKVIGVIAMRDENREDDKLVAVHVDDPAYSGISDLVDLPAHRLRELRRLFLDDKPMERTKVQVGEPQGRRRALQVLLKATRLYAWEFRLLRGFGQSPSSPGTERRRRRPAATARNGKRVASRSALR